MGPCPDCAKLLEPKSLGPEDIRSLIYLESTPFQPVLAVKLFILRPPPMPPASVPPNLLERIEISVQEMVWFVVCCAAEHRRALPRIKIVVEPSDSWPVFWEIVSN